MSTKAAVPNDSPLMIAWNAYMATPEYENTKQWATAPAHTDGSLWAAFSAGFHARALEQPAQEGWREIASVPKDGTMVLCWVSAVRCGEDDEGRQHEADVSECDFGAWRDDGHGGYFDAFASPRADMEQPTHWMPLPAAPTKENSNG